MRVNYEYSDFTKADPPQEGFRYNSADQTKSGHAKRKKAKRKQKKSSRKANR